MTDEQKREEQKPTEATVTAPPAGQTASPGAISAEEANKLFQGGEVTLDERGNPVSKGGTDPQEGATLRKRHAWY